MVNILSSREPGMAVKLAASGVDVVYTLLVPCNAMHDKTVERRRRRGCSPCQDDDAVAF